MLISEYLIKKLIKFLLENPELYLNNKIFNISLANVIKEIKFIIQFFIGLAIIVILCTKGIAYLSEFVFDYKIDIHFFIGARNLNVFDFVGKALGVSAGIELAYMLFTDGPDEAISPLIMAVASGAFFSISNIPDGNWVIGVYCLSLVVLLYARKQYEEWENEKKSEGEQKQEGKKK